MQSLNQANTTPREYSLTTGRKTGQTIIAGVFIVSAGFIFRLAVNPIARGFLLALGGLCLISGIILIAQAWTSRLILDGGRIEVRSLLRTRSATLAEIDGVRIFENDYGRWTRIYLKQELGDFNVSNFFSGNEILQDWLKGVPDLDRRDADVILKQVGPRESLAQERTDASKPLNLAKAWAIGLSALTGAASIPVMFVSYAPIYRVSLILLLVCPVACILLLRLRPILFTILRRKPDPRADLGFLLFWPGFGLLFSLQLSNDPTHLVDMFELIYWVFAVVILLFACVFPAVWRSPSRWPAFLFLAIVGGVYSMGLVNAVNTLLDHSPSRPFRSWVLRKSESHTSKGTRYFLRVAAWGPLVYPEDIGVPLHTYNTTSVGDPVCYGLHPGFLHGPWYMAIRCSDQSRGLFP